MIEKQQVQTACFFLYGLLLSIISDIRLASETEKDLKNLNLSDIQLIIPIVSPCCQLTNS